MIPTSPMALLVLAVAAATIAFWIAALVPWVARRVEAGLKLVFVAFLVDAIFLEPISIQFVVRLYPADIVFVVIALATASRAISTNERWPVHRLWWLLGAIQFVGFIRGASLYGTAAGVAFRPAFYVWIGAVYIASFGYSRQLVHAVVRTYVWQGFVVCGVAVFRWFLVAVDSGYRQQIAAIDPTELSFMRVVQATQTMALALAAIPLFYAALRRELSRPQRFIAAGFAVTILLLQHRSVWIATVIGSFALIYSLSKQRKVSASALISRIVLVSVLIGAVLFKSGLGDSISSSLESQAITALNTENSTFVGRIIHWRLLFGEFVETDSPLTYAIGLPYGHSFADADVEEVDEILGVSPHDQYLAMLLRTGVLGLLCFLRIAQLGLRRSRAAAGDGSDPDAPLLFALVTALLLYYIPYEMHYCHVMIWGVVLAYLGHSKPPATT